MQYKIFIAQNEHISDFPHVFPFLWDIPHVFLFL